MAAHTCMFRTCKSLYRDTASGCLPYTKQFPGSSCSLRRSSRRHICTFHTRTFLGLHRVCGIEGLFFTREQFSYWSEQRTGRPTFYLLLLRGQSKLLHSQNIPEYLSSWFTLLWQIQTPDMHSPLPLHTGAFGPKRQKSSSFSETTE